MSDAADGRDQRRNQEHRAASENDDVRDLPESAFDPPAQPTTTRRDDTGATPGGGDVTTPQDLEADEPTEERRGGTGAEPGGDDITMPHHVEP